MDCINLFDNQVVQFENFNNAALLFGCGDCEDFSFIMLCLVQHLQFNSGQLYKQSKLIQAVRKVLDHYICTCALVTACRASMMPVKEGEGNNATNKPNNLHMTCFLVPKWFFLTISLLLPPGVTEAEINKHYLVEGNPLHVHLKDSRLKHLDVQFLEGTSLTYPNPYEVLKDYYPNYAKFENDHLVGVPNVQICVKTQNNFKGASTMFYNVIEFSTNYFLVAKEELGLSIPPSHETTIFDVLYRDGDGGEFINGAGYHSSFNTSNTAKFRLQPIRALSETELTEAKIADEFELPMLSLPSPIPSPQYSTMKKTFQERFGGTSVFGKGEHSSNVYYLTYRANDKEFKNGELYFKWPYKDIYIVYPKLN
jgi:hypothetical protein